MSHLALTGEIRDEAGMASTVLAAEVGYPGTSIAFAQLLSGMERSGLIEREIRGKRTYRISPARSASAPARTGAAPQRQARPMAGQGGARPAAAEGGAGSTEDFDYDELARRLLLQVVERLSTLPVEGPEPAENAGPGAGADSDVSLARAVAGLEQKLASVRSNQQR